MSVNFSNLYKQSDIYDPNKEKIDQYLKDHESDERFQHFMMEAIKKTCIWIHPDFYQQLPHIAPYSIRGRTNSSDRNKGIEDNWGSAFYDNQKTGFNKTGFMIDDNSDIKDFIRHRKVLYQNNEIEPPENGYIACHIWENTTQNPYLFSFIPNLVWCPKEIARLSDDQKSYFSRHLKEVSLKLYHQQTGNSKIDSIIQVSWKYLDTQNIIPVSFGINDYCFSQQDVQMRKKECLEIMNKICSVIESYKNNLPINIKKIKHKRYLPSLEEILKKQPSACDDLYEWLSCYKKALS